MILENGDVLYYLGEKRVLTVIREQRTRAKIKSVMDRILMWIPYEADYKYKREQLEKWYRKEALAVIGQKALEYAQSLSVHFESIRIKDQRSRWGSCSSKGNLNFNCLLMLAPPEVLDYVVVHELCHRKQMNHSKAFWTEVEKVFPDYKKSIKWLKEEGSQIMYMVTELGKIPGDISNIKMKDRKK